jgi:hypothetical protein
MHVQVRSVDANDKPRKPTLRPFARSRHRSHSVVASSSYSGRLHALTLELRLTLRLANEHRSNHMIHKGSCHCGKISFEVEGDIDGALACNCSICSRKGSLLWFVPRDKLRLKSPEDAASTYTFNKHVIKHRFCPTCGMHPYGEGVDPKGNAMAAINLRCVEDIDLDSIPVRHFDGRAL